MPKSWTTDAARPQKHSLTIKGHRTSVSLEPAFWSAFRALAANRNRPLNALAAEIDADRGQAVGLASAIRLYVLDALGSGLSLPEGPASIEAVPVDMIYEAFAGYLPQPVEPSDTHQAWMARDGGQPVGGMILSASTQEAWKLAALIVVAPWRRRGIGTQLIATAPTDKLLLWQGQSQTDTLPPAFLSATGFVAALDLGADQGTVWVRTVRRRDTP